jgi:site-specific recombinase XerD
MFRSGSLMVESERGIKKHTRKPKLLPKYLEKTKIDEMLEKACNDNKRNYLILLTLQRTGIRNSELIYLIGIYNGEIVRLLDVIRPEQLKTAE